MGGGGGPGGGGGGGGIGILSLGRQRCVWDKDLWLHGLSEDDTHTHTPANATRLRYLTGNKAGRRVGHDSDTFPAAASDPFRPPLHIGAEQPGNEEPLKSEMSNSSTAP